MLRVQSTEVRDAAQLALSRLVDGAFGPPGPADPAPALAGLVPSAVLCVTLSFNAISRSSHFKFSSFFRAW